MRHALPLSDALVALVNRMLAIADCAPDDGTRKGLYTLANDLMGAEHHASRMEQDMASMERALDERVQDSIATTLAARWSGNVVDLASARRPMRVVAVDGGVA